MTKKNREEKPDTMLFSFGILPFVASGFTDSFTPCGLTVLFLFVTALLFLAYERQIMIKGGYSFILGLFLSKFFMVGPLDEVRSLAVFGAICRYLYLWIGLMALVLAGFHMRDWWFYKKIKSADSFKIGFPLGVLQNPPFKAQSQKMINQPSWMGRNVSFFSFIGGILLGMLGSVCPEPFYITTFLYTLTMQGDLLAVVLGWLMYALGFIFPLVGVLLLFVWGIGSLRLRTVLEERRAMVKIVCSAVLLAVGVGLIYTFY